MRDLQQLRVEVAPGGRRSQFESSALTALDWR
jgi:hypothetical protein